MDDLDDVCGCIVKDALNDVIGTWDCWMYLSFVNHRNVCTFIGSVLLSLDFR